MEDEIKKRSVFLFFIGGVFSLCVFISCKRTEKKDLNNSCQYSDNIKRNIEKQLSKPCSSISSIDFAKIKKIDLRSFLNKEDELSLHNEGKGLDFLSYVEELDLSSNQNLKEIPEYIVHFKNLKILNISDTQIKNFNDKICSLENLTTLIAKNNQYTGNEIPFSTFCLKKLEKLDMSNSKIKYIDEYIYYLNSLKELHMQNNELVLAPSMLAFLPHLIYVDFKGNNLIEKDLNKVSSCKDSSADSVENCKQGLSDSYYCEYRHEIPFERGTSFRKVYEDMTGRNFSRSRDRCYIYWLYTYFSPYQDQFSQYTINGKTLREWKLLEDKKNKEHLLEKGILLNITSYFNPNPYGRSNHRYYQCQEKIVGMSHHLNFFHLISPNKNYHLPSSMEINIDRFLRTQWEEELIPNKECKLEDWSYLSKVLNERKEIQ